MGEDSVFEPSKTPGVDIIAKYHRTMAALEE
jgi:hypothetical protein